MFHFFQSKIKNLILPLFYSVLFCLVGCQPDFNKNNLTNERSLFLSKSKKDSIHWQKWDEATLKKVKNEKKLIYLSIGYGTCFACEKMQKESYATESFAKVLNEGYVAIKVDRDEQPDVDIHFLNMQTAIMKFGAWPILLILTSDLKPLYAMTYMTQSQLIPLLNQVKAAWEKEPEKILSQIDQFLDNIQPSEEKKIDFTIDESLISDFYSLYTHQFDPAYGGIKSGQNYYPKFPINDDLRLLLRYYIKKQEDQPLQMVKKTMTTLSQSALFDQLEGGIHRYSTTRDWNTPNFEKGLMDQASFLNILTDLYLIAPENFYAKTIEQTVNYLINNLLDSHGGFYSGQSSSLNGLEGLYHTWQDHEIQSTLSKEEHIDFLQLFSLNAPQNQFMQRRTLSLRTTLPSDKIKNIQNKLLLSKHKKIKPEIDKKVMTAQTAYTLSALIKLAKIWPSDEFEKIIKKGLDFLLSQHQNLNGTLYRQSVRGQTHHTGVLDDYSYLVDALIEYYQLSFNEKYLLYAQKIQKKQDQLFFDVSKKSYSFNSHSISTFGPQYLMKDKPYPSGQSMTYLNLIRLSNYFPKSHYSKKAEIILNSYPDQLKLDPLSYTHLLLAIDLMVTRPQNLIISGTIKECQEKAKVVYKKYFPYLFVTCTHSKSQLIQSGDIQMPANKFKVCRLNSCLPDFDHLDEALQAIYSFQL